jgi:thioredoxin-like negative regulator of GroEL
MLFSDGTKAFQEGRFEDALAQLKASYELSKSPNALLMMARTLAKLGKRTEAAEAFYAAELDARRRSQTEPKYQQTADTAVTELAALRPVLGTIRLRVHDAPDGTKLTIDGQPRELRAGDVGFRCVASG